MMFNVQVFRKVFLSVILLMSVQAVAQTAADSSLNPQAMDILKKMSDYLAASQQFVLQAEITVEGVINSGQKLHFERHLKAYLRRPDRARVEFAGDYGQMGFWYDGSKMTLLDYQQNLFASAAAPAEIDKALDNAMSSYGVAVPVADFLVSDVYGGLTQELVSAMFVGKNTVRGRRCFHLAFTQASIDWQIWVEDGEKLVPRKLVITYKTDLGQPQYTAVFTDWEMQPNLADLLFAFTAPAGSEAIKFLTDNDQKE